MIVLHMVDFIRQSRSHISHQLPIYFKIGSYLCLIVHFIYISHIQFTLSSIQ